MKAFRISHLFCSKQLPVFSKLRPHGRTFTLYKANIIPHHITFPSKTYINCPIKYNFIPSKQFKTISPFRSSQEDESTTPFPHTVTKSIILQYNIAYEERFTCFDHRSGRKRTPCIARKQTYPYLSFTTL